MLVQRFHSFDFEQAKNDVLPFVKDVSVLNIWCEEFFVSITQKLENKIIEK